MAGERKHARQSERGTPEVISGRSFGGIALVLLRRRDGPADLRLEGAEPWPWRAGWQGKSLVFRRPQAGQQGAVPTIALPGLENDGWAPEILPERLLRQGAIERALLPAGVAR